MWGWGCPEEGPVFFFVKDGPWGERLETANRQPPPTANLPAGCGPPLEAVWAAG